MRILTLILIALMFNLSCSTKLNQGTTDKLAFSVRDTLQKYANTDSIRIPFKILRTGFTIDTSSNRKVDKNGNPSEIEFCDTINAMFHMGRANNSHFGMTMRDGKIAFYQKINNEWIISDSTDFSEPISLKYMDLNGDSFNDLRISYIYDNENGDLLTCVFIYDPTTKRFKLNESFGQANVEYDAKNKFVKFWIGCKEHQGGVKWRGKIVNDKLKVDSTITFAVDTDKVTATLDLYKGPNGAGYYPIKSEVGNSDSLWIKFNKTFWTSNVK
jgi:hypothetical protein